MIDDQHFSSSLLASLCLGLSLVNSDIIFTSIQPVDKLEMLEELSLDCSILESEFSGLSVWGDEYLGNVFPAEFIAEENFDIFESREFLISGIKFTREEIDLTFFCGWLGMECKMTNIKHIHNIDLISFLMTFFSLNNNLLLIYNLIH